MTISLMHQIQFAERDSTTIEATLDPRFVPNAPRGARTFSAWLLRSSADRSLRLANRIDPGYLYA
ncbi:MAG: hypothetical protein ACOH1Y_09125 [Propionicimonas sp.]